MLYGAKAINKKYPTSLIKQLSVKKAATHKEYYALERV
jgi:hypothetical protein